MHDGRPLLRSRALVGSDRIGERTRAWAYVPSLPGAQIGTDCNICDHLFIENNVRVGNRVTIKSGVQLWDGVRLADDVFVDPNATSANDLVRRSRNPNFLFRCKSMSRRVPASVRTPRSYPD